MNPTKQFTSLGEFAAYLTTAKSQVVVELRKRLVDAANGVAETARGELGHYQPAVDHFPAWVELHPLTKKEHDRVISKGGAATDAGTNTPLLLTGELRESVEVEASALEAAIGTAKEEGVYMELGTDRIPPRPFLGPALVRNEARIKEILGAALLGGIIGPGFNLTTATTTKTV